MSFGNENLIDCSQFEELLTDYLDKTLESPVHKSVAAHALSCPLCHGLLNEVRASLDVCRELSNPTATVTRLEARILERTIPQSMMGCSDFEEHLTDYLDGFLAANVYHRWERHAVSCDECTDLPGSVVRTLATIVSYKLEELPVPAGLHQKILRETLGTTRSAVVKASLAARFGEWVRGFQLPISIPQLAPVAMMLMLAFLIFSQTVSADGTISGIYASGVELAEQTYKQSADAFSGKTEEQTAPGNPVTGTTFVDNE